MVVDLEVDHVTMDSEVDLENDQDRGKNPSSVIMKMETIILF